MNWKKRGLSPFVLFAVLWMSFLVVALFAGCSSSPVRVTPFASAAPGLGKPSQVAVSKSKKAVSVRSASTKAGGTGGADSSKILPVSNIQQLPELKSGCEITSGAIVLKYFHFPVTKSSLLPYLSKSNDFRKINGKQYGPDPWKTFAGDPQQGSYGCYAPVLCDAINNYLLSAGSGRCAYDITGTSADDLYDLVDHGMPVIVWVTSSMTDPQPGPTWYLQDTGKPFQWLLKEHVMVLIGYRGSKAVFSDPEDPKGTVSYDRALFEQRYRQMHSQAVIVD